MVGAMLASKLNRVKKEEGSVESRVRRMSSLRSDNGVRRILKLFYSMRRTRLDLEVAPGLVEENL